MELLGCQPGLGHCLLAPVGYWEDFHNEFINCFFSECLSSDPRTMVDGQIPELVFWFLARLQ